MEKKIKFKGYSIKEFNLKKHEDTDQIEKENSEVIVNSFINKNNKYLYKVVLKIIVNNKNEKINMVLEGTFEFPKNSEEEQIKEFLKYSAPSILYPYCRSFISFVTGYDKEGNIMLPILNFYE